MQVGESIDVNLGIFVAFCRSVSADAAPTGLGKFGMTSSIEMSSLRGCRDFCYTISKSLYRINRAVHPDPVGAVLRCTHPNAICIPNRTGHDQKH